MTKKIRIENADTSSWPVRVTVENKGAEGEWTAERSVQIDGPTQMTEQYITSHRRIVIEELPAPAPVTKG